MPLTWSSLSPLFALLVPATVLLAGLVPTRAANARSRAMARLNESAAWLALAFAVASALTHAMDAAPRTFHAFSMALPGTVGNLTIGSYVNGLTVTMLLLVTFVGAIVSRYSRNYLAGDPQHGRFHKWLSLTLASILSLIVSGNLLMFALAWIATSLSLHQLLMFYRERPVAVLSAHKKFIASRIGDVSLLVAIVLIGSALHTLEFADIMQRMAAFEGTLPVGLQVASGLVVLSAALKSAQFPLHGWLLQVMEAPTPVSALLHAGVVNAGAFLALRMSPILSHSTGALVALALVGLVTLSLASLVMLTQTSIKVSLAWSTAGQMGFMLLECGLGLYSLAMLHLVAHSLYKAHAFLASGSGVDTFRAPAMRVNPQGLQPLRLLAALGLGGLLALGIGSLYGVHWSEQPALLGTGIILAVAMSQLTVQASAVLSPMAAVIRSASLSALLCIAYFTLHALFQDVLASSVLPVPEHAQGVYLLLAPMVAFVFLALLLTQIFLQWAQSPARARLYVHLYNGLYIDVYITRALQTLWPAPAPQNLQPLGA